MAHFDEDISVMCFSLHSNKIATSAGGIIFCWEYEHLKLVGACSNEGNDVTFMTFIDPYSILLTHDKSNMVCLWNIVKSNAFAIYMPLLKISFGVTQSNFLMQMVSLVPSDLEDISYHEKYIGFAARLNKQFRGEYFKEEDLINKCQSVLEETPVETKNEKDSQFDDDDSSSLYITSAKNIYSSTNKEEIKYEEPQAMGVEKISNANTVFFADDSGNVCCLDIEKYLIELDVQPIANQSQRSNYFPYRTVKMTSNGIFGSKEEVLKELDNNPHSEINYKIVNYDKVSILFKNNWNAFSESLTLMSIIQIPKKLIVTSAGSTVIKIFSIFGEPLCISNLDQPLPYQWRLVANPTEKLMVKMHNSILVLKDIEEKYPKKSYLPNNLIPSMSNRIYGTDGISIKSIDKEVHMLLEEEQKHEDKRKVLTFSELYSDVLKKEKQIKTATKMSLKQLEAKRKEKLIVQSDQITFESHDVDPRFDKLNNKGAANMITNNESLVDMYETSIEKRIIKTQFQKGMEDMLESDHRRFKAERKKQEVEQEEIFIKSNILSKIKSSEKLSHSKKNSKNFDIAKLTESVKNKSIIHPMNEKANYSISLKKEESEPLKPIPSGILSVSKTIDKSLKTIKKSSSALNISANNRVLLSGGYKHNKLDQNSRNLSKYFKPKILINPKEIDWMSYAKMKEEMIPELK